MDYKLIRTLDFLQGANAILIENREEFDKFIEILSNHRLEGLVGSFWDTYEKAIHLLEVNRRLYLTWDGVRIYAECQVGKQSIAFGGYTSAVDDWYGDRPYSIKEIA